MPELPEVETLRIDLLKKIRNEKIENVKILNSKIVSGKNLYRSFDLKKEKEFVKNIKNLKIENIERIAKNLIFKLENKKIIIAHLKMTGQFIFEEKVEKKYKTTGLLPNKHTKIIFYFKKGNLYYNDIRGFGYVLFYKNLETAKENNHFKNNSLEPFDKNFTLNYFKKQIKTKNKTIKTVFLEQSVVNGVGNIYSDEICFSSKIRPGRIAKNLNDIEINNLYKFIKLILKKAIKSKGSSVSDYVLSNGKKGDYSKYHNVYGRNNKKCFICKTRLKKIKISGRSSVFCPKCQI